MHPKPEEEEPNPIISERSPRRSVDRQSGSQDDPEVPTQNLIQLDG